MLARTQEKSLQVLHPVALTVCNVVKLALHLGGERSVDKVAERPFEELGHSEGGKRWDEFFAFLKDISSVLDRRDDAGVCAGTSDPFVFEHLHERGFGVARRWLGFMADGADLFPIHRLPDGEHRQDRLFAFDLSFGIVGPLDISAQKSGKRDLLPTGPKNEVPFACRGGDFDLAAQDLDRDHLTSDRPLPNQLI